MISNDFVKNYQNQHSNYITEASCIPPVPLHIIINAIEDFIDTAIELYSQYPQQMVRCITSYRDNCYAYLNNKEPDLSIILYMSNLYRFADQNNDVRLKDFCLNRSRMQQLIAGDLSDFELLPFVPLKKHKKAAQRIFMNSLDLALQEFNKLDNDKNCSDSTTTTARLSDSSQERSSFELNSVLFQEPVKKDAKHRPAKCECT